MDLLSNPSYSDLMALNMNDTVKFLHLNSEKSKVGVLTKDDITFTPAQMPNLPQQVDSYNVNCMAWCAFGASAKANRLAVALANGKVILLHPGPVLEGNHPNNSILYQASKPCTALSWNKVHPELLAMGLERSRTENGLLIWDLGSKKSDERSSHQLEGQKNPRKPIAETCFAETVNSVMWTKNESKNLIAGVSAKHLRMYDLRNIRSPSSVANTKATYGLCPDPCLETRFASFYENQVHIWDLRNFSKPAAVISAKFNILKADWCPTRKGLLATISSGSSDGRIVRVYDTSHTMVTDSEPDIAYRQIEQIVKLDLSADEAIGTFAWQQALKNHLIAVTNAGTLHCVNVPEKISLGWTKDSRLFSANSEVYQCDKLRIPPTEDDEHSLLAGTEHIMYKRALNGYGINETSQNHNPGINLEAFNTPLHTFWKWIQSAKESSPTKSNPDTKSVIPNPRISKGFRNRNASTNSVLSSRFLGLHHELKQCSSSSAYKPLLGVPNTKRTVYECQLRNRALKTCGWRSISQLREDSSELRKLLLESNDVERAATIALWHLDMHLAIDILRQNGAGNGAMQHPVVAMALSGYTGDAVSPLWREMCNSLEKSMPSSYLRAAFAFLNTQDGKSDYRTILKSKEIAIHDRIGFACTYLPDDVLVEVLDALSGTAAKEGDLEGVIATGLTMERGIELLQNYVDRTKDVQTAALALIQTGSFDVLKNKHASNMIEGYRSLLNMWMLWKERAKVDNAIGKIQTSVQMKQSLMGISVQCNFCGKSVRHSTRMQNMRGRGIPSLHASGIMNKTTSCPSCRKPLPRCSVCCMYLGTSQNEAQDGEYSESDDFDLDCWFTWCPVCQHGGHTNHLTLWFREHANCPVPGCTCNCLNRKESS